MNYLLTTQSPTLAQVFIALEIIFFFIQVYDLFRHPHEQRQWWYLILLFLLIGFNFANGLFPDIALSIPLKLQYILAYGSAYLMGAYIPFYFYKNFELLKLRFHATYGVAIFLLLPYLIFDVILYLLNGRLIPDRELGVGIPAVYGIVVLITLYKAIRQKRLDDDEWTQYPEALAVWAAILPWELMSAFAFFTAPQWLLILLANMGWLVITLFMMVKAIRNTRQWYKEYARPNIGGLSADEFLANCLAFSLTRMEILVVQWVYKGKSNKQIAEIMYVSEETIKKHLQNIFRKVKVKNRVEMIHKLQNR